MPQKLMVDERTQAVFYKSPRYPEGLTPEWVNSNKPNQIPKNGQVPWPMNKWTPFDSWHMTNNWFHRINDRTPFALFCGWSTGLHNSELYDQPYKDHVNYSERTYDDNIIGQTVGGAIIGLQLGALFGMLHTFNLASEANIFQSMSMPPNRWLPRHKAGPRFRFRIVSSCMIQCSSFLAAYGLFDGCISQLRHKDDMWNPILGGLGAGCVLWGWFRNPFMTIPTGFVFGVHMMWFRFMTMPDDAPKPGFDLEKPLWGVFGGLPTWIMNMEPDPERLVYQWFDTKYRTN